MGADDKKEASDPKPVPGSAEGKPTSTSAEDNKPSVSTPVVRDMDEDIPHPMFELYRHTILRGANLGSVVTLILGPPYLLYKRVWGMEFLRRMGSICAKGTVSAHIYFSLYTLEFFPPCQTVCQTSLYFLEI